MHLIEVNTALIDDLVRLIAESRAGRIHNLDIPTVVSQIRDICAIVRLNRIGAIRIQRSVCFEIAIVVVRRRRSAHKGGQHRRCAPLIYAPLRAGITCVIDGISPCGICVYCICIFLIGRTDKIRFSCYSINLKGISDIAC